MKMSYLHMMNLASDKYKRQLDKEADPINPELEGQPVSQVAGVPSMVDRSGVQDTPLKPRHRKYFNAYSNKPATDKLGYPDQAWSNIKKTSPSSKKIRPYNVNKHH